jgi:hypothetical protein
LTARSQISQKELSECDREPLHHIGSIQGGTGHLLFINYPSGKIIAYDEKIQQIPWIVHRTKTAKHQVPRGDEPFAYSSDSDSSATSTSQSGDTSLGPNDMLDTYLQSWIPYKLYTIIYNTVEGMKVAQSQRGFHFYTHRKVPYALSLSTTMDDFSVIGIEIEEADAEEVRKCACLYDSALLA